MKTAISIPDELFEELDKVSKQYRASRSHVITLAIGEYLDRMKSRNTDLHSSGDRGGSEESNADTHCVGTRKVYT